MKWLLLLIAVLFAAAVAAQLLLHDPGYVLIGYGEWSAEMSLAVLLAIVCAIFVVLHLALRLAGGTRRLPRRWSDWVARRRSLKARRGLTRGLMALAEGDWGSAEKQLLRRAEEGETPLLHYLAAARAAQGQHAYERRDHYLKLAQRSLPDADLAVGLTQAELQLEEGQLEQAESTLLELRRRSPGHRQVLKLLMQLFMELADWERMRGLLPDLRKRKAIPADEYNLLELKVYGELLDTAAASGDPERMQGAWSAIPKDLRRNELLLLTYVRHLLRDGRGARAEPLLRDALNMHLNDPLAELYGLVEGEDPVRQLEHAESWLAGDGHNPVLLQMVGRIAARGKLWGKARSIYEGAVEARPSAELYRELGEVHEAAGDAEAAARCYREASRLAGEVARRRAVGTAAEETRLPAVIAG